MSVTQQTLSIGEVQLNGFEVPNQIANLFGVQKMAIHDFPGGQRTIQNLGAFPYPHIEWTGNLFDGNLGANTADNAQAMARAELLNNFRMQSQPITLNWGAFSLQVVVAEFEVIARMKQWLEYRIKLIPFQDNTPADPAINDPLAEVALNETLSQLIRQATAPASAYIFSVDILNQVTNIQANINTAMVAASQKLSEVPTTTIISIQQQITTLQLSLDGLMVGQNFAAVSAAIDLYGTAGVLIDALNASNGGPIVVNIIDPNLFILAGQYYDDVGQAANIALANNLQDFVLTGSYLLTLPNLV
jgi:hypothetical protein